MEERAVVLVGNGPSRATQAGISWEDLLRQLRESAGVAPTGHEGKPFALHFEELRTHFHLRHARNSWDANDRQFRSIAARLVQHLMPNEIHRAIMALPVSAVLTTNYDYSLERAVCPKGDGRTDSWGIRESRYSLFLRRKAGDKHVFHLHGEARKPATIILGQQAYVDSCARIRKYATVYGEGLPGPGQKTISAHFRHGHGRFKPTQPHSWVDLFMLRDVHILGLGLDLSEVDLWYLISYKARLRHLPKVPPALKSSRIYYHTFENERPPVPPERLQLLNSFGVDCILHSLPRSADPAAYLEAWHALLGNVRQRLEI